MNVKLRQVHRVLKNVGLEQEHIVKKDNVQMHLLLLIMIKMENVEHFWMDA